MVSFFQTRKSIVFLLVACYMLIILRSFYPQYALCSMKTLPVIKKYWVKLKQDMKEYSSGFSNKQSTLNEIIEQLKRESVRKHQVSQTIYQDLQRIIGDQLPSLIYIPTYQPGEIKITAQFLQYLDNPTLWDVFEYQNERSIQMYMQKQVNQGAIVNKDTMMQLITQQLFQYQKIQQKGSKADLLPELIHKTIQRYHQEILNLPDFALDGQIIHANTSTTYGPVPYLMERVATMMGIQTWHHVPEFAIQSDNSPRHYWSMMGQEGTLGITLNQSIHVQAVTVEYPFAAIFPREIHSAPQRMEIYGLTQHENRTEEWMLLGKMLTPDSFQSVLIKIKSNWGNKYHTNIYRIRIHGIPS
ncbi:uncharacterized protein B0P05DRAFT_544651 [Gilbertella persicaria]|uniref:uncharacterized protein n=1 Tax=Gilbertella persicaria TaxID=101096 RepID=UPI00221F58FD|nr:uncharacterized protein B0P05DRAFT_544651 [Gilbertella persicaria]KAI8077336.1 hypothetical protein B0P05DRAFT_544651 [Gilbertella persicaria]